MKDYFSILCTYQHDLLVSFNETAIMLLISILFAILLGLPLGTGIFLTRKNGVSENKWLYFIFTNYVNIARSFPFLLFVVALIPFTRWLIGTSFGTYAAAVPLSFVAIALYARQVEQCLLEIPSETIELAKALGANKWQLIVHFLFVEARSALILSLTSLMIALVSYSTVMGVVGGGGIGDFAIRYGYQRYEYALMYTAVVIMILCVIIIQYAGNAIATKLDKRKRH